MQVASGGPKFWLLLKSPIRFVVACCSRSFCAFAWMRRLGRFLSLVKRGSEGGPRFETS